jgi:hypothetical protein
MPNAESLTAIIVSVLQLLLVIVAGGWALYKWIEERRRDRDAKVFEHALQHRIQMFHRTASILHSMANPKVADRVGSGNLMNAAYIDYMLYANKEEFVAFAELYRKWKKLLNEMNEFEAKWKENKDPKLLLATIVEQEQKWDELQDFSLQMRDILNEILIVLRKNIRKELKLLPFDVGDIIPPSALDDVPTVPPWKEQAQHD